MAGLRISASKGVPNDRLMEPIREAQRPQATGMGLYLDGLWPKKERDTANSFPFSLWVPLGSQNMSLGKSVVATQYVHRCLQVEERERVCLQEEEHKSTMSYGCMMSSSRTKHP